LTKFKADLKLNLKLKTNLKLKNLSAHCQICFKVQQLFSDIILTIFPQKAP